MKKKEPKLRQCALTRETKPAEDLIRFVLGPDNIIVPDTDAKAEGRGVWISLSMDAVDEAASKNIFARSLAQKLIVPEDLALLVRSRLEQRLLGSLGLARKAGQLAIGGAKVRSAIVKNGILALFTASDAAPDGRNKIMGLAASRSDERPFVHVEILTSDQLGLALGRENVIHAALIDGAAASSALERINRLVRYVKSKNEK